MTDPTSQIGLGFSAVGTLFSWLGLRRKPRSTCADPVRDLDSIYGRLYQFDWWLENDPNGRDPNRMRERLHGLMVDVKERRQRYTEVPLTDVQMPWPDGARYPNCTTTLM